MHANNVNHWQWHIYVYHSHTDHANKFTYIHLKSFSHVDMNKEAMNSSVLGKT